MTISEFAMAKLANSADFRCRQTRPELQLRVEAPSAENEAPSARNELESAPFRAERSFAQSSLNEILNDFLAEKASNRLKELQIG